MYNEFQISSFHVTTSVRNLYFKRQQLSSKVSMDTSLILREWQTIWIGFSICGCPLTAKNCSKIPQPKTEAGSENRSLAKKNVQAFTLC